MFLLITKSGAFQDWAAFDTREDAQALGRAFVGTEEVMGYGKFSEREYANNWDCSRLTGFGPRQAQVLWIAHNPASI